MEQRTQFTFYDSFRKAAKRIEDPAERCLFYDITSDYALGNEIPDLDALPSIVALAFELIKPTLDASRRKAEIGKRGGESKQTASSEEASGKQSGSKTEAKPKQTASKKENKKESEKENKKEKENECYNPLTPLQEAKFSPLLLEAVNEWLRYKHERKEDYKPTGLEAMTTEISNRAAQHGDVAVADLIRHCMASNWRGIIWEKITMFTGGSKQAATVSYQRSGQPSGVDRLLDMMQRGEFDD